MEFREHYLARHELKPAIWTGGWQSIYQRLPQDTPLTVEVMRSLIFKTDPNTRNRLETCRKFQKLADFASWMRVSWSLKEAIGVIDLGNEKIRTPTFERSNRIECFDLQGQMYTQFFTQRFTNKLR